MIWSLSWRCINKITKQLNSLLQSISKPDINAKMNENEKTHLEQLIRVLNQTRASQSTSLAREIEILNNIAYLCKKTNQFEEAIQYYTQCLELCLKCYGETSPSTGHVYTYLGTSSLLAKNYNLSKCYFEKSLEIFSIDRSAYFKEIATSYTALAFLTKELGDKEESIDFSKKALEVGIEINPKDNRILSILYSNYADTLEHSNQFEDALHYFKLSYEIISCDNKPCESIMKKLLLKKIGDLQIILQDYEEAIESLKKSTNLLSGNLPLDIELEIEIILLIADCLQKLNKNSEALDQIKNVLEYLEQTDPNNTLLIKLSYEAAKILILKFQSYDAAQQYYEMIRNSEIFAEGQKVEDLIKFQALFDQTVND